METRFEQLDAAAMRRVARIVNVPPSFNIGGKQKYLRTVTLIERVRAKFPLGESGTENAVVAAAIDADRRRQAAAPEVTREVTVQTAAALESGELLAHEHEQGSFAEVASALEAAVKAVAAVSAPKAQTVDEEQVRRIAREVMDGRPRVTEVTIKRDNAPDVEVGIAHKQFSTLVKMLASGVNVYIAGPAGSGKTHAARQAAEALSRKFYANGAIDTEYKLSGFVDAQGRIVSTPFRRAFTEGNSVYLFDEVDASLAPALLAFSAALANSHADFPGVDEPVLRPETFSCIAAGNTFGHGATSQYIGRNKLDAATIDRFVRLDWDYDEELEKTLAGSDARDLVQRVIDLRRRAQERGMKVVISPRASIHGAKLMRAGFTMKEALEATIFCGMTPADKQALA